ncbi:MAG: TIGR03619 family F420-dependent LLM class oxidoreductase [Candidatus Microthrix sp.]|uniref:TIGR03619 family F420-dependent LLM class oxidoreductase n=1 Tax=Candidatus Neomicrothrix sp. TaxID=2719034 RepID=UPI0025C5CBCE|nr:TIGR03619 family F420-dependent LLM class oxidoreductase [Candidatus Microthrix sp.]MBL0204644.1 TIGR03619 family F420-dependent LLM class oxidoreductase [Candidatus Microthrix sp.]
MKFTAALAFTDPDQYLPLAKACEDAGIWAVACSDHVVHPREINSPYPYTTDGSPRFPPQSPFVDPFVAMAAMGAVTERLRFFTNIYVLPLRHPLGVAKQLASITSIIGNRVALGMGVGWMEEEFELMGADFRTRGKRADEAVAIMRGLWDPEPEWFSFEGEHYRLPEIEMTPRISEPVPIYVGGISEFAYKRAARLGDGWISDLMTSSEVATSIERIEHWRAHFGTQDQPFEYVVSVSDVVNAEGFARLEDLGVTSVLTMPWVYTRGFTEELDERLAGITDFADQVISQQ